MMQVRRAQQRGHANLGWLDSYHTFSFADYYDPEHMAFRVLRVINEDQIAGGAGFPTHGHRDMEIITYMVDGAIEHKDTMGNASVIYPGEVQRMSAGSGVQHSEFNHFKDKNSHLLQIWILPDRAGHKPGYEQKSFVEQLKTQNWVLVASPDGQNGSLMLHQYMKLFVAKPKTGEQFNYELGAGRGAWIQIVKGSITANGQSLNPGDGLAIMDEASVKMVADKDAEFLFFDLP